MNNKKLTKKVVKRVSNKSIKKVIEKPIDDKKNDVVVEHNALVESNTSGVPKNFVIRCSKCCWSRLSSGIGVDLVDLHEIKSNCNSCGKARKFQCPKCGLFAFMKRIKGNLQK